MKQHWLCRLTKRHKWGEVHSFKLFLSSAFPEFDRQLCQRQGCDAAFMKTKPIAVPKKETP